MKKTLSKRNTSTAQQSKVQKKNNPTSRLSEIDWTTGRFQIAAGLFLIVWAVIWFRAFFIQLIEGPMLAEKANRQHMYTEMVEAKRGTIYDRNKQVLARSIEVRSIYANPRAMVNPMATAEKMAELVNVSEKKLKELFSRDKAFVWVARKVDDATATRVQNAKLEGIGFSREFDRVYPQKHLAGQLLGFVGIDNVGLEGIERSFNKELAGEASKRVIYKDGEGRRYYMDGQNAPQGQDIYLTIDGQIQYIAEEVIAKAAQEVQAAWGGVLIVEAKTGDIAAWAQYPFFNPNNFRNSSPQIYKNRIAADALEPGSTLKAFPVAAALEEGIIDDKSTFHGENGVWETKYITISDDGRAYQDLTVNEILRYSSNIGVAKIGLELGIDKYHNYLARLGFGSRTNIGIAESKGIMREPDDWTEVDLMSAAFGQSVAVTGIQMAQAYLTLANKGVYKPVQLIKDENKAQSTEQRIFSTETAKSVMAMLEDVVESNGTGTRARVEGVRIAGKTGTAQKAEKANTGGYGEDRFASFVGIVPANDPLYIIIVMLDEPKTNQYGGAIAAPVFQEVATRVLAYGGYLPDVIFANEETEITKSNESKFTRIVEFDENQKLTKFPNLVGASLKQTLDILIPNGINPEIRGSGLTVLYQYPAPDTPVPLVDDKGTPIPCVVWLSEEEVEVKLEENVQAENESVESKI